MKSLHWEKAVMKAFGYGGEKEDENRGIIEDEGKIRERREHRLKMTNKVFTAVFMCRRWEWRARMQGKDLWVQN